MLLMNNVNKNGPKFDPCGTPEVATKGREVASENFTTSVIIQVRAEPLKKTRDTLSL